LFPNLKGRKFEWQDEYFALSVSESVLNRVRNYIKNQEEHHKKKSLKSELDSIVEKYSFVKSPSEDGGNTG
jgi:putative transposase